MSREKKVNEIISSITEDESDCLSLIVGEYRQGKTFLLNSIKKYYLSKKKKTFSIESITNIFNLTDYCVFINFISNNENIVKEKILKMTKNIAETNKYANTVMKIMKDTNYYPIDFNTNEILLIQRLKNFLSNRSNNIILCDDFDHWDEASQSFLLKLLYHKIFKKTKYIITCNANYSFSDEVLSKICVKKYELENFTLTETTEYLHAHKIFSQEKEIFESTRGNIGQINDLLSFLKEDEGVNNFNQIIQNINNMFISKMPLKDISVSSIEMVNKSSILGMHFKNKVLEHFSNLSDKYEVNLLNVKQAGVLKDSPYEELEFNDEFIWKILVKFNNENKLYHLNLAKTIRAIMPSNFLLAGNEFLLAGNETDAARMYFLALMQRLIRFRGLEILDQTITELLEKYDYKEDINKFIKAYEYYFKGNFDEALNYIPIDSNNLAIKYEIDFIKILILINSNVLITNYQEAYKLCLTWTHNQNFEEKEPYLWLKMAILSLEISSELHYDTKELYQKIMIVFSKYIENDDNMEIEFNCFKMQNNYNFTIDIQYIETKAAVAFFEKKSFSPSWNLLICSYINHSANALVLGEYKESIELNQKALRILSENTVLKEYLPSLVNNDIVTKFLYHKGNDNLTEYISIMEQLVKIIKDDYITKILLEINLGLLYFYHSSYDKAINLYKNLYSQYAKSEIIDDYYRYFITNNYNFLELIINNKIVDDKFVEKLNRLAPYFCNQEFFQFRTNLINDYIKRYQNTHIFRPMLSEHNILGKAWSFWGRVLLFTDIQYWTY